MSRLELYWPRDAEDRPRFLLRQVIDADVVRHERRGWQVARWLFGVCVLQSAVITAMAVFG